MLVPQTDNPDQGKQSLHEWKGFKRWYYVTGGIAAGRSVSQQYMLQLGAQGSAWLPNLANKAAVDPYANEYLGPHLLTVSTGSCVGSGFDNAAGAYTVVAANNTATLSFDFSSAPKRNIVLDIADFDPSSYPLVKRDGAMLTEGSEFLYAVQGRSLRVFVAGTFAEATTLSVEPAAGSPCSSADRCRIGMFDTSSGHPVCTSFTANAADDTACDDSNACTSGETCLAGVCGGGLAVACPSPGVCQSAGHCDSATGGCVYPQLPDGNTCTDGICQAGQCQPSTTEGESDADNPDSPADADSPGYPASRVEGSCGCTITHRGNALVYLAVLLGFALARRNLTPRDFL